MTPGESHRRRLNAFGFVVLDGFASGHLPALEEHFAAVQSEWAGAPARPQRLCVPDVARKSPFFDAFVRWAGVEDVARSLLGEDCLFLGGDLSVFVGDTRWHLDSWQHVRILKLAIYLDAHVGGEGSLRVMPGSHHPDVAWRSLLSSLEASHEVFGLDEAHVPCWSIDIRPGDLVAFDLRLQHGVWGGRPRRQLAYRFAARPRDARECSEIARYVLAEKNLA